MPRPRSAKAMTADLHRRSIRELVTSIKKRRRTIEENTGVDRLRSVWEFVGAVSHMEEQIILHLDAMDRLAK